MLAKHLYHTYVVLSLAAFAVSCDGGNGGPSIRDLGRRFAVELPAYIHLKSFDVQASDNIGNKVDPVFKARFLARVALAEDTFVEDSREAAIIAIIPQLKAGEQKDLYGTATSTLNAGAWRTEFSLESNPLKSFGQPRSLFSGGIVAVKGSPELKTVCEKHLGARPCRDFYAEHMKQSMEELLGPGGAYKDR